MPDRKPLSRESILDGHIQEIVARSPGVGRVMSDDERERLVGEVLALAPSREEVWIFAYGSLIWNPAIHVAESKPGVLHGYRRQFCFWTRLGRGCENNPGLMLGLEPGGSCAGVLYRIDAALVESEIDILFRREMISYAYVPTWVEARCGARTIPAITFVMDPRDERYCGGLDARTMVHHLATAEGQLGRNCDYLFNLVEHLQQLDLRDAALEDLARRVRAYQASLR